MRYAGSQIPGDPAYDFAIATSHQNVGDRLGDLVAAGNGEQMSLTFSFCEINQIKLGEKLGILEHRTGYVSVVIVREAPHYSGRSVDHRGKAD